MKIQFFVTIIVVSVCCLLGMSDPDNQEAGTIDFDSLFYNELLRATVFEEELDDLGEIPDYVKDSNMAIIVKEAKWVEKVYPEMMSVWSDPNLSPAYYQEAAVDILRHLELNETKLLTFGLVVDTFGVPDRVSFSGYHSDESGTIASMERFTARYKQKGVDFGFSVSGFCSGVRIYSSRVNKGIIRWPQTYAYATQFPILSNLNPDSRVLKPLLDAIVNLKNQNPGFYDWVSYMERWPKSHKVPSAKRKVDIMMIDRIQNDLVIVYLKIAEKKETLYCDTWWKHETNEWKLLNDEQVSHFFKAYSLDDNTSNDK